MGDAGSPAQRYRVLGVFGREDRAVGERERFGRDVEAGACDTGEAIAVPVGDATLGRILNVIGEPVDEKGPVEASESRPIHATAPEFQEQSTESEILVTGIKVVDLLAPY